MKYHRFIPVTAFFVLTLLWSGGIWIIMIPSVQTALGYHLNPNWDWLGLVGPGLMAIVVTTLQHRMRGLRDLFQPFSRWKQPLIYYLFVYAGVLFFYCAASWLTAITLGVGKIQNIYQLYETTTAPFFQWRGILMIAQVTVIYTLCEELGWRGYALPELNKYLSALSCALIISVFWTLWHIPLIYLYGNSLTISHFLLYYSHIASLSLIYTWLYFKTNRSLLMVGLLHGTTDAIGSYFPATSSTFGQGANLPTTCLEVLIACLMVPYLISVQSKNQR